MDDRVKEVQALGQSFWYDNIDRRALESGEIERLIESGITGVTSNPTIFMKALSGSDAYDEDIARLARKGLSSYEIYDALLIEDIAAAADLLRPVFDRTGGGDGFVSIEPNPALAYDVEGTIAEIRRLHGALGRPNVMVKAPGTIEAIPAIEELLGGGYNINITLLFSPDTYSKVAEAYVRALERFDADGGDLSTVSSVASFFVSRVDTSIDKKLQDLIDSGKQDLERLLGKAAVANSKIAYQLYKGIFMTDRFDVLRAKGARVQRPLWASTSTKNPEYSDTLYVDTLIGPDTVNTLPGSTYEAFRDHGTVAPTLDEGLEEANDTMSQLAAEGIDITQVTDDLVVDGVKAFAASLDDLLKTLEEKRNRVIAET